MVHGEVWTLKELFVLPNEYIYWSIQIVLYPFMTGLVAGAFVLSSLYHVFGVKQLKDIARFALVFSFALLWVAPLPVLLHLQHPLRGANVMMTAHFTSAIAAFSLVFITYASIVASELWFLYRKHFVLTATALKGKTQKNLIDWLRFLIFSSLTLGAYDLSEESLKKDEKAIKVLATAGIPVAFFLHGYVGFIFGSVKANALWTSPLIPVIFIMSAIVSGIALCMLTYIVTMELRKLFVSQKKSRLAGYQTGEIKSADISVIQITSKYLVLSIIFALTLELLDLVFKGYTAVKSWDILKSVIFGRDFMNTFILQFGVGNILPFILFLLPKLTLRRTVLGTLLVLFGVFMMRYNTIIGGQAFSLTFMGYMDYHLPIIPHDLETFKEGLCGVLCIFVLPFILFYIFSKLLPVFSPGREVH